MTPNLKVAQKKGNGRVVNLTPENAGWTYVGFDLHRLTPGGAASGMSETRETCLVFVTGKGRVNAGSDLGELG